AVAKNAAPETVKHDREKDIQEHVDNELKSLTNEGIIARATSKGAFVDPVKAAALAQELARRDLTTDARITPLMDRFVATASNLGNLDKVTNNRPDLMPQRPGETREQATARAVREAKGDVIQVNPQIFNLVNPAAASARLGAHITPAMLQNAILTLTPAQLGALGSDTTRGSQERQNNITDSVRAIINAFGLRKPIITPPPANSPPGTPGTPTGKFELDTAALAAAAAAAGAPPELRNLEKIIKHMESSPNWGSVLN
ncbi:MAG TPA: hypothetical protein VMT81_00910, partial [Candidatus Paceibacterota bacterium]|nr:hypothetical protein [Candidatus Paceibacterota bacterium]